MRLRRLYGVILSRNFRNDEWTLKGFCRKFQSAAFSNMCMKRYIFIILLYNVPIRKFLVHHLLMRNYPRGTAMLWETGGPPTNSYANRCLTHFAAVIILTFISLPSHARTYVPLRSSNNYFGLCRWIDFESHKTSSQEKVCGSRRLRRRSGEKGVGWRKALKYFAKWLVQQQLECGNERALITLRRHVQMAPTSFSFQNTPYKSCNLASGWLIGGFARCLSGSAGYSSFSWHSIDFPK